MALADIERGYRQGYENERCAIHGTQKRSHPSPHWDRDFRKGFLAGRDAAIAKGPAIPGETMRSMPERAA